MTRAILHIDMDAFYASIEQRDRPELKGKPVIVGGSGERGVVAAASYEVRTFGVRSAMPMREALRLCPHAVCIHPRIAHYREVSKRIFSIFHEFTPLVEGLSLDEAFLDVTHSQSALGSAEHIARSIKQRIREHTQLTASAGVAPNKLVAKIASDLRKPDGLMVVTPDAVTEVLDPLPVTRLFGVGTKTAPKLYDLGIYTFGDLRRADERALQNVFGKFAAQARARASGIDDRPVVPDWDEKQISSEETFEHNIGDHKHLHVELTALADRTAARLRAKQLQSSCVVVKIRRGDFITYTRQQHIEPPTQETRVIATTASKLLNDWLKQQPQTAVRLLGVGVTQLEQAQQMELFTAPQSQRNRELDATLDRIRDKFGHASLKRGDALNRSDPHNPSLRRKD